MRKWDSWDSAWLVVSSSDRLPTRLECPKQEGGSFLDYVIKNLARCVFLFCVGFKTSAGSIFSKLFSHFRPAGVKKNISMSNPNPSIVFEVPRSL